MLDVVIYSAANLQICALCDGLVGRGTSKDSAEYKKYQSSCTRINVTNPVGIAR